MSSRGRTTGHEPEFRWVIAGRRTRLSLVRRLSLSFELRRREGEKQAELWLYAEDSIRRWRISARGLGALHGEGGLAAQMEPLPVWAPLEDAPPRWDQGRCVIEASSFNRLHEALDQGPVSFALQGERVNGEFVLERTPLSLGGRPQWIIRREDSPEPARGRG